LTEEQQNVDTRENFNRYRLLIVSEQGLSTASSISVDFNPAYQKLTFHHIFLERNGKKIDQTSRGNFEVLRREKDLERSMYDGYLTSVFNLIGLQVGDVIDYAYTISGENPILPNKYSRIFYLNSSEPIATIRFRLVAKKPVTIKNFGNITAPQQKNQNGSIEYLWERFDVKAVQHDDLTPGWFDPYDHVQISQFNDWTELGQWGVQLFQKTTTLENIQKKGIEIKRQSENPEEQVRSAIEFVQDEIRYLSFSLGVHSFKPHDPERVLSQRFGDCKDKSFLLVSLLHELGVQSAPVLVNTTYGKSLPDYKPSPFLFNHCVVQIQLNDSTVYIDPTISFQRGPINNRFFPNYGSGLVLSKERPSFVAIPKQGRTGSVAAKEVYTFNEVGAGGALLVSTEYLGQQADNIRQYLRSNSLQDISENYLNFYASDFPNISLTKLIQFRDDEINNQLETIEEYTLDNAWKYDSIQENWSSAFYARSLAGYLVVPSTKVRSMPMSISYPLHIRHKIEINLPEDWMVTSSKKKIHTPQFQYDSEVFNLYPRTIVSEFSFKTRTDVIQPADIKQYLEKVNEVSNDLTLTLTKANLTTGKLTKTDVRLVLLWLLVLGIFSYAAFRFYQFDSPPRPTQQIYDSIGGWLLLVLFSLFLTPIGMLVWHIRAFDYLNHSNWLLISDKNYPGFDPLLGVMVQIEFYANSLLFIGSVLALALFLQKRTTLPTVYIGLLVLNVCIVLAQFGFVQINQDKTSQDEILKELVRSTLLAAIWIPYFLFSNRVKGTFIVRRPNR
jgi:hypothetical protein